MELPLSSSSNPAVCDSDDNCSRQFGRMMFKQFSHALHLFIDG